MIPDELLPADLREWPIPMLRIARPPEAEKLSGMDWDTLERNYPQWVLKLSLRCKGMRVGHCLKLAV
jgi:hypothetical protein